MGVHYLMQITPRTPGAPASAPACANILTVPTRVGIDLVAVDSVREALATHGEHYLTRIFTPSEIADCGGTDAPEPERLAARFAAKEAALKVLRPGETGMALTSIEVLRGEDGSVGLSLTGPAAEVARAAGLSELSLSLTHEGAFAAAVVIAQ